jgi:hypothetical protein
MNTTEKQVDLVNEPPHYTQGVVECIDALESIGIGQDFCRGNAIKYLWRIGLKGDPVEDCKKAIWYCNRLLKLLEKERDKNH